jgi:hypothetical protein
MQTYDKKKIKTSEIPKNMFGSLKIFCRKVWWIGKECVSLQMKIT